MNLCRCIPCSVFLAFLLGVTVPAAGRNVVMIVADDQGQDAGCYGNPVIQTPNLDRLAAEGALFTDAFATTASCSASRSVILSGLHNHRTGQYGHQHSYHHFQSFSDLKSLPVLLSEAGYRTAIIGKLHVAPDSVYRFDRYLEGNSRNAVEMAENSRAFISADPSRPFFLYFCPTDPHRGGGPARELPYQPDRFGNLPEGYPGVEEVRYDPAEVLVPPFLPDTPTARAELAQYYQSVSRIDQGLGKLVNILKDAGVYDDTLILYLSDHGIAFPGAKTTVYEPGLRSPCIVRNPYLEKRGLLNRAMISWTDLTPTILDFAGILEKSGPFHGRSFLPVLGDENPEGWDEVYASHTFHEITMYYPMRVVRTRRHKLIWNLAHPLPFPFASDLWAAPTWQEQYRKGPGNFYGKRRIRDYLFRPRFELYDLTDDPYETRNLAGSPEHRDILADLKGRLRQFQVRTEDPWILKWDHE